MALITPEDQAFFGNWPIDTLLEKHELYLRWNDLLAEPDGASFIAVSGQSVLVLLSSAALSQFEVVRAALDPIAELATIFLARRLNSTGEGLMLIARKVPELPLYVTVIWHDWYAQMRSIVHSGRYQPVW